MSNVTQSTDRSFVHQLKRAVDNRQDVLFHFPNDHSVTVLGSQNKYFCNGLSVDTMAFAMPSDYRIEVIDKPCKATEHAARNGRPLPELIWRAAYSMSDGSLLPGCKSDDVIKLNQWPNLTRLSRSPNICRIAALFTARPTSIELASRILVIPIEELFQFYSAASYAGYTTVVNKPKEVLRLKPHRRQSLIKNLLDRFTQTG